MNDRVGKFLLALIAIALWGLLLRPLFQLPALRAQSPPAETLKASVVVAHEFQIVDDKGEPCGRLIGVDGNGAELFLGKVHGASVTLSTGHSGAHGGSLEMTDII